MKSIIFLIFCLGAYFISNAQTSDTIPIKNGYLQVSFISPISTAWKNSINRYYHFSLNLVYGRTGGVQGVEMGFINQTLGRVNGWQTGAVNIVNGKFNGVQVGVLMNVNKSNTNGLQLSGLWTHNQGNFSGFQFSWFGNTTWGDVYGAQLSHLWNHSNKSLYGIQFALGPNTAKHHAYGIQFSATMNYAGYNHKGIQFAFLANYVGGRSQGFQISPLNIALKGAGNQIGVINYTDSATRFQGGLINIARRSGAFQIGLINYSGDNTVAPIGLVNIVKKGYNKLEIWGGELQSFNIALKTGGRNVYSILNVGINPFTPNFFWTTGWGVGGHIPVYKRLYVDLDNITSLVHINEAFSIGKGKNTFLNQTRFMAGISVHKRVAIFLGPVVNFLFSDNNQLIDGKNGIDLAPTFRTGYGKVNDYQFAIWPGIGGGIRFF
ncbi:MAG: hypothetical protein IAE67_01880 [Candidatus Competibacteraceae bacterium]|nr:hypothetical protein [Candidatus Competibacteraceae bacterium]